MTIINIHVHIGIHDTAVMKMYVKDLLLIHFTAVVHFNFSHSYAQNTQKNSLILIKKGYYICYYGSNGGFMNSTYMI